MGNVEQTPQFGTKGFNDLASDYFGGKPKQSIKDQNAVDDKEIEDLSNDWEAMKQQMSGKKETLEELALDYSGCEEHRMDFIAGFKACEEQNKGLYSEEDMINFAYHYINERKDFGARALTPELLINQFKKK